MRQTKAMISFALVAPEAKEKSAVSATAGTPFSRWHQMLDNVTDISGKVATFEPDYWRLDGSFLLPLPPEESDMEVGFWSENMSDGNGDFDSYPQITVMFSEVQNVPVFGVAFDAAAGEAADTLRFDVYNSADVLMMTETIAGNTESYVATTQGRANVGKVVITFMKTAKPFRHLRVLEIDFGCVLKFDGNDILQIGLITEGDPEGKSFPQNQLRVSIVNNKRFNQLDEDSFAQYLYKRQAFEYRHGLVVNGVPEWIYGGVYYLDNWAVSDRRVEFVAYGKAAVLENSTFYDSSFAGMTAGDLVKKVLENTKFSYSIPEALVNSPLIPAYLGNVSYRQALSYVAEMSGTMVYEDKQGAIKFNDILMDGDCVDTLDYGNMFEAPKIRLGTYYNGINLKETTVLREQGQLANMDIAVNGSAAIVVYFERPFFDGGSVAVSGGFAVADVVYHTMYMTAILRGNGKCTVTVSGNAAKFAVSETFYRAAWHDLKEPDYPYAVDSPMFIVNGAVDYAQFRDWFLQRKFRLLKKRITCDVVWRQNPEQEIGDMVYMQTDSDKAGLSVHTYKEEISFDNGVLKGSTRVYGEAGHA